MIAPAITGEHHAYLMSRVDLDGFVDYMTSWPVGAADMDREELAKEWHSAHETMRKLRRTEAGWADNARGTRASFFATACRTSECRSVFSPGVSRSAGHHWHSRFAARGGLAASRQHVAGAAAHGAAGQPAHVGPGLSLLSAV